MVTIGKRNVIVFATLAILGINPIRGHAAIPPKLLPDDCKALHPTIGVAVPNMSNPYYVAMRESFLKNGADEGFKVAVAVANDSNATQLAQIDAFVQQRVCAVALNPVDSGPAAAMVATLTKAGIPTFNVNIGVETKALATQHGIIAQYVGADQFQGGMAMGQLALEKFGKDGKIIAGIIGDPQHLPLIGRDEGFKAALATDPNATVARFVNGLVDPNVSLRAAMDMLQGNPSMNVIFSDAGPGAVGAIQAIKALHRTEQVSLFAFCAADTKITPPYMACAAQQPAAYAKLTVESIKAYISGRPIKPAILLPVDVFHAGDTPPPGELG